MDASTTGQSDTQKPAQVSVKIIPRAKDLPAAPPHAWHWPEYGVELVGTAWLVFAGLSGVIFDSPGMPGARLIPDASLRLWVTGLIFAGSGSLYTISPWGRLSGSHINPAVTLGFCAQGKVRWHDGVGYIAAQCVGGWIGAAVLALVWGRHAAVVNFGVTLPGPGYRVSDAFWAEFLMTGSYLLAIFYFVSRQALLRWTPLMNWIVVSGLVWLCADISGTSLNPARSFGPALVAGQWKAQWIYAAAPPLGALAAVAAYQVASRGRKILTAKLYHSELYRTVFKRTHVPHRG